MLACCQGGITPASALGTLVHSESSARNGFLPLWNAYGLPGAMFASLACGLNCFQRARAYFFDSKPAIGSAGGKYGSP